MGCDIHIIAEVKESGKWRMNTDKVFVNNWYEEYKKWIANEEDVNEKERLIKRYGNESKYQIKPNSSRNYDWFSILANVRNGSGFAGIKTGNGFDVIAEPRGLPDDISDKGLRFFCYIIDENVDEEIEIDGQELYTVSKEDGDHWIYKGYSELRNIKGREYVTNPDYHSMSYLSIEDFDNFNWDQTTTKIGVITLDQYKELRGTNNTPKTWSGGVSGGDTITISMEEADRIINGEVFDLVRNNDTFFTKNTEPTIKKSNEWKNIYVEYTWEIAYDIWFKNQIEEVIKPLRTLAEKYEDARLVFAFDN